MTEFICKRIEEEGYAYNHTNMIDMLNVGTWMLGQAGTCVLLCVVIFNLWSHV